jgi:hypothetical protein
LGRDIKVFFGYDVPILVDYTYAQNEVSEHLGSGEMAQTKSGFVEKIADY